MIGGQEKALISMLNVIPKEKYDITVLTLYDEGELREFLPSWIKVKIIPKLEGGYKDIISDSIKSKKIKEVLSKIYYLLRIKLAKTKAKQYYYTTKIYPRLEEYYDVIIHYHSTESFLLHYIANNTVAERKIAWIHSDISNNLIKDKKIFKEVYSKYNKVFSVSKASAEKFLRFFPELKHKIEVFYNIVDPNELKRMATYSIGFDDGFDGKRILTVARLSKDKGQELIPSIVKKLLDSNYKFKWYLVGEGDTRKLLEEKIGELDIRDNLILLGTKTNPYPYMNECDIYVQPSVSEGLCISLFEARCFNKPVIATNFNGAKEQIINGETGFIVPINDIEKIYLAIKELLDNSNVAEKFSYNLSKIDCSTKSEIKKLYKFIDNV